MANYTGSKLFKYSLFLSAWAAFWLGYFFRNCTSPIVYALEADLNTTATGVGFLGSFIHLFYFSAQIPCGILLQFVHARHLLPISVALLGVASLLFSFSQHVLYGTVMSSMAGLAASPAWLCFVCIIEELFTRAQIPFIIGVSMMLQYGGLFAANYAQAEIYNVYGNWRIVFQITAVLCWVAALLLVVLVYFDRRQKQNEVKLDKASRHDYVMGSSAHELDNFESNSKQQQPTRGDNNQDTQLLAKAKTPRSYKQKLTEMKVAMLHAVTIKMNWILSVWGYCGLSLVNGLHGMWFISYLMLKFQYSRPTATLVNGSFYLMRALSAPIIGRLAMRYSKRKIFILIGSVMWICTVCIIYILTEDAIMGVVLALNFVSGLGAGSWGIMWALQREYNAYYQCKDMSAGLVNTLINSSGFVTQLFIGEMLDAQWKKRSGDYDANGVREYTIGDYDVAMLIIPAVVVMAIISALFLKETHADNLDYSEHQQTERQKSCCK